MNLAHGNVSFQGIGGGTISKMLSFDFDKIKAFQPKVIILELGTNDLCVVGQRPESVGSDIEHLVQVLHDHCGAEFIMVCLVIYQSAIRPHVPDFSHGVDLLNKYLKVVLEPHSLMLKCGAIEGFKVHLLLLYAEMAFI